MCIIIYKPAGVELDWNAVKIGSENHTDGTGFMVRNKKGLYFQKGLWTLGYLKQYIKDYDKYDLGIHFRSSTSGKIDKENCHPFKGTNWTMMHNGTIPGFGTEHLSDTGDFVKFIDDMYSSHAPYQGDFYESLIGYSKLLFAVPEGPWVIVNEQMGIWENKIWYSNASFRPSNQKWRPNYPSHSHYPIHNSFHGNY